MLWNLFWLMHSKRLISREHYKWTTSNCFSLFFRILWNHVYALSNMSVLVLYLILWFLSFIQVRIIWRSLGDNREVPLWHTLFKCCWSDALLVEDWAIHDPPHTATEWSVRWSQWNGTSHVMHNVCCNGFHPVTVSGTNVRVMHHRVQWGW